MLNLSVSILYAFPALADQEALCWFECELFKKSIRSNSLGLLRLYRSTLACRTWRSKIAAVRGVGGIADSSDFVDSLQAGVD